MTPDLRLCLSLDRAPTADLDRELQRASEVGFALVEFWAPTLDAYLRRHPLVWLDMQLRQLGICSVVVNGLTPLYAGRTEDALTAQAHLLELCAHLDALGGGSVVLHPAASQGDTVGRPEENLRALRAYADLAAPFEVILAVEFRANSAIPDLESAQDLVERAGRSTLRLSLSAREWVAGESEPQALDALRPGQLALVHLDDQPHPPGTEGARDPAPKERAATLDLCGQLAAAGFRGPYCIAGEPEPGAARQAALDLLTPLHEAKQTP